MNVTSDAVERLIKGLDSAKGDRCVVSTLSSPSSLCLVNDWVSSGCYPLDLVMGGGFPVGRITEIYGDTSTGKSLLATMAVLQAQKRGILCVFADVESAVSRPLMEQLGVDTATLVYYAPDTVNELFDVLETLMERKDKEFGTATPMLFIWDSVAATATREELDTDDLDKRMYPVAAVQISRAMRKITRRIAHSNVCCIFINQTRQKLDVMFGDNVTTYGGRALGFHSSVRLRLRLRSVIRDDAKPVGIWVEAYVSKNRLAPPFQGCLFPIYFGYGVDELEAMFIMGKEWGIIKGGQGGHYNIELPDGGRLTFTKRTWYDLFPQHEETVREMLGAAFRRRLEFGVAREETVLDDVEDASSDDE